MAIKPFLIPAERLSCQW